jgi:hypothetical protein
MERNCAEQFQVPRFRDYMQVPRLRDYMREAMNCYMTGSYRDSIGLCYIALFDAHARFRRRRR